MPQAPGSDVGRNRRVRFPLSPGPQLPKPQKIRERYFWGFLESEEGKRSRDGCISLRACKATAFIVDYVESPRVLHRHCGEISE